MPKASAKPTTTKIHGVAGSDEGEIKRVASALADQLQPEAGGDFGREVIDGSADNVEQAATRIRLTIEALQTIPFFGGAKLVWLKNANFLADNVMGRSATVQDALEELTETLNGNVANGITFLLSAIEVDKRRSFYKSFAKKAELQVFDRLDANRSGWEEEASELARKQAAKRKLEFNEEALMLFVLLTGGDTRQVDNELEKIDLYLGRDRAVSVQHVQDLVPLSRSGVIFELGNALVERNLARALELVRRLLDQGENAIGILLVAILPTIRNLLLAGDLMRRYRIPRPHMPFHFISALNRLPAEATAHLPRKKDGAISGYALGLAARNADQFETNRLLEGMDACLDANVRLVTTQLDHELILTEIVIKVIG